jgi:hypothetical protein
MAQAAVESALNGDSLLTRRLSVAPDEEEDTIRAEGNTFASPDFGLSILLYWMDMVCQVEHVSRFQHLPYYDYASCS